MGKLLILGPLPPPLTGTPISFEIFCEETKNTDFADGLVIVDSSPKFLKQQKKIHLSTGNLKQALAIIFNYASKIKQVDHALIFGSNGYIVTLAPILLIIAKIFKKECYFRVFGGSLDQYVTKLRGPLQWIAHRTLDGFTGVIVETELLRDSFSNSLKNTTVHYVPGYRIPSAEIATQPAKSTDTFKMAFIGIVKSDKGIFVLLDAMGQISQMGLNVELTVFGSIHEPDRALFESSCEKLANTTYGGVLDWREIIDTLKQQDVLVHPTFYHSEGHPGVIIEAMMAGIPVLSTDFRSIPEIIKSEHNGLLVKPNDAPALVAGIERLCCNQELLARLADKNAGEAHKYTSTLLVSKILSIATKSAN